ncbi:hypothetical protein C8Q79DRAFT_915306 [Trametes meyenii]|nr:hypothetical protein C8Q79DRAFT_915306 [Trametes meyenii]
MKAHLNHVPLELDVRKREEQVLRDRANELQRKVEELLTAKKTSEERTRQEAEAFKKRVAELQRKVEELLTAKKTSEERARQEKNRTEALKERVTELEWDVRIAKSYTSELEVALAHEKRQRVDLKALLDTRAAELKEAQAYLSKADDFSDDTVRCLLEHINSQAFQLSTTIAEHFQGSYGTQTNTVIGKEAVARLERSKIMSPRLPRILYSVDHKGDSTVAQIALQAVLVAVLYRLADPWRSGVEKQGAFLHSVYEEMSKREPQSILGKWRTMTLGNMYTLRVDLEKDIGVVVGKSVAHISNVLLACRVGSSPEATRETVQAQYGTALKELMSQAFDLGRTIGERVLSRDLRVNAVWPATPFAAATMEDDGSNPRKPSVGGPVLCTMHLGLIWSERAANATTSPSAEDAIREVILVKPKVVLESTINDLLRGFKQLEPLVEAGTFGGPQHFFALHLTLADDSPQNTLRRSRARLRSGLSARCPHQRSGLEPCKSNWTRRCPEAKRNTKSSQRCWTRRRLN